MHKKKEKTSFTEEDIFKRGVEEIIDSKNLKKKINSDKKLRIKFGIDPTSPDIHLGHTINLWKLRQFQDLGHTAVVIIGDYTSSIGDPSGRDKTRPPLTKKEIEQNYKTYKEQLLKILTEKNLEIHLQSEWFNNTTLKELIKLTSKFSVSYILSHETFSKRLENNKPFSVHELLYPFLQGYDSVAIKADVELGASEQKFNLLIGRDVQKQYDMEPQDIIISKYLIGLDGKEKMSKSLGNYISLQDKPKEMFGKIMSINDEQIVDYFELITPLSIKKVEEIKKQKIEKEKARDLKMHLAEIVVETYWGKKEAQEAQEDFVKVFQKKEASIDIPEIETKKDSAKVIDVLLETNLVSSKSEARRFIEQGAVRVDGEKIKNEDAVVKIKTDTIVSVGKRKSVKLKRTDD